MGLVGWEPTWTRGFWAYKTHWIGNCVNLQCPEVLALRRAGLRRFKSCWTQERPDMTPPAQEVECWALHLQPEINFWCCIDEFPTKWTSSHLKKTIIWRWNVQSSIVCGVRVGAWHAYAEQLSVFFRTCVSGSGGRVLDSSFLCPNNSKGKYFPQFILNGFWM